MVVTLLSAAPAAEAAWGTYPRFPPPARPAPPDQSWLTDVPEKPGAHGRGKVAVFVFKGDDVYQPVRATVVRMLRRRRLHVTTSLKPVVGALEYREVAATLNMAAFIEGEVTGEGPRQSALITLYSGLTGHRMAQVRASGPTEKIVADLGRTFWTRLGPPLTRACTSASRPRKLEREPLRIDAGDPADAAP